MEVQTYDHLTGSSFYDSPRAGKISMRYFNSDHKKVSLQKKDFESFCLLEGGKVAI